MPTTITYNNTKKGEERSVNKVFCDGTSEAGIETWMTQNGLPSSVINARRARSARLKLARVARGIPGRGRMAHARKGGARRRGSTTTRASSRPSSSRHSGKAAYWLPSAATSSAVEDEGYVSGGPTSSASPYKSSFSSSESSEHDNAEGSSFKSSWRSSQ
jgi:hypothetical protein